MTFGEARFHPLGPMSTTVPVLSVGGIAKQWLVPGWRLGWGVLYDPAGVAAELRKGLTTLTQLTLGPCGIVEAALPAILAPAPEHKGELLAFKRRTIGTLEEHAKFTVERLTPVDGLTVVPPQGAMYAMIGVDVDRMADIEDDRDFVQKLLDEEGVFVLPGQCFGLRNFVRIVLCPPLDKLRVAYDKMEAFCARHLAAKAGMDVEGDGEEEEESKSED
eukprot:PLAT8410.1.p2 GENE.PLAT8410.1~~PLAT8410.1.p2  ORF type:complete len:218 (+),score=125.49 PLAT8410.1:744-1397(+)